MILILGKIGVSSVQLLPSAALYRFCGFLLLPDPARGHYLHADNESAPVPAECHLDWSVKRNIVSSPLLPWFGGNPSSVGVGVLPEEWSPTPLVVPFRFCACRQHPVDLPVVNSRVRPRDHHGWL